MSTLIQNSKHYAKVPSAVDGLPSQQRTFVLELLATDTFNPTDAARAAGYKQPSTAAHKLMKKPAIQRALGRAQREREERCQLKADDVLHMLARVLYFNPLHYFRPGDDGTWFIQDPATLPEEVGRMITKFKVKQKTDREGNVSNYFEVELMDKNQALQLSLKHLGLLTEKVDLTGEHRHTIDWDSAFGGNQQVPDTIKIAIEDAMEE